MPDLSQSGKGRAIQPLTQLFYNLPMSEPRYNERSFVSGMQTYGIDHWCGYQPRLLRYSVGTAMYEGTAYRDIHKWAEGLKAHHDLYEAVQALRSPAKRIVDLTASYVYRGPLDLDAGDGSDPKRPTSIPIILDDETLRPVIAQILRLSVWQTNKDCYGRDCASKGDVFLQAVDDPAKQRSYFVIRDPATVYDVTKDAQGNIRGYTIVEPRHTPGAAVNDFGSVSDYSTYIEVCIRDDETNTITYRTFKDRISQNPDGSWDTFAWDDDGISEWTKEYGFVPMVHVQFKDVGKGWGWNAYQGSIDKLIAIDDVASKINDQIRKLVDFPTVFSGCSPDEVKRHQEFEGHDQDFDRESSRAWYIPTGASANPLIGNMNIADVTAYLESLSSEIKEDFPILIVDDVSPDASGKSRQLARGRVESEVYDIRANLDAGLVKIIQMTLSIMAIYRYPGPDGIPVAIPADAYERNLMGIKIGGRPVFAVSDDDKLDQEKKRSDIFGTLVDKGMPFEWAARKAGYSEDDIKLMMVAKDKQDAETQRREQQAQADAMAADATTTMNVGTTQ